MYRFLLPALLVSAPFAVSPSATAQDLPPEEVRRLLSEPTSRLDEVGSPIPDGVPEEGSYIPNEVVVRFRDRAVSFPASAIPADGRGLARAKLSEVGLPTALRSLFRAEGVRSLRKVFPDATPADSVRVLPNGQRVRLPDLSQVFVLEFPDRVDVLALVKRLSARPDVLYAEPNVIGTVGAEHVPQPPFAEPVVSPILIRPLDPLYPQQWSLEQPSDEDIDAEEAWNTATGSYAVRIGIIDSGVNYGHVDLGGNFGPGFKVAGGYDYVGIDINNPRPDSDPSPDQNSHGTHVAGIAGALTNNVNPGGTREGIAGVAGGWGYDARTRTGDQGAALYALKIGGPTASVSGTAGAQAIREGADPNRFNLNVLNNSWGCLAVGPGCYSETIRSAVGYAARLGRVFVAAKGNDFSSTRHYPSDYDGSWVISVGAMNQDGSHRSSSNTGNGIDVSAPGERILSTVLGQDYALQSGTSMATPHVSGLAALLLSQRSDLHPQDIEGIIRASAEQSAGDTTPGYDDRFGAGRINAARALARLRAPYELARATVTGGSTHSSSSSRYQHTFYGPGPLTSAVYLVKRHDVRRTVTFSENYQSSPAVWCRGPNATVGWSAANSNHQIGYCDVVSQSWTSATLRTFVYEVWDSRGRWIGWFPTTPSNVQFAYTRLGIRGPLAVRINGPTLVALGSPETWYAQATGGTGSYSYRWYEDGVGTGVTSSSYSTSGDSPFTLSVVADDGQTTAEASIYVEIYVEPGCDFSFPCPELTSPPPEVFAVHAPAPNPARREVEVRYDLPAASDVRTAVYDVMGREVAVLAEGHEESGYRRASLDVSALAPGIYVVHVAAGASGGSQRLTVIR